MSDPGLRIARLRPGDTGQVTALFATIATDPGAARFHPHPFGPEDAIRVCTFPGADIYAGAFAGTGLVGYAMLRGWDEGFEIPALGIYLAPAARGTGAGRHFMAALHAMALERGAKRVMLKVYPDNDAALALYRRIGYVFDGESNGQLVGHIDLLNTHTGCESQQSCKGT